MTETPLRTRDRILDAAERLFASYGFEGASIRAIVEAAQVNLAAVHYHFRSKDALLEAVLTRRIAHVNEARLQRLESAQAAAAPDPAPAEQVLRAFIVPTLEFAQRDEAGATFVQLMSRMFTEPRFSMADFLGRRFGDTIARFSTALVRALPQLPPQVVLWRVFFTIGAMHHLLCAPETIDLLSKGLRRSTADNQLTEYLVEFSVGGMCAPTGAGVQKRSRSKADGSRRRK
jgi:AcrR family transcriptional regulator